MLAAVAAEFRVTEPSGEEPSLTRVTARVSESPGTKLFVVVGTVKPCGVTSMERVPDAMVEAIGVLLSVKVPKVPRPATAAAAPRTPSEPTTLRAVGLEAMFLAFMSGSPWVGFGSPGGPATGRLLEAYPQAPRQRSARNPQGMRAEPSNRALSRFPGLFRGLRGADVPTSGVRRV